jgi:hypothetical protein
MIATCAEPSVSPWFARVPWRQGPVRSWNIRKEMGRLRDPSLFRKPRPDFPGSVNRLGERIKRLTGPKSASRLAAAPFFLQWSQLAGRR